MLVTYWWCISDWRVLCWRLPLQFRLLVLGRGVATCDIFRWGGQVGSSSLRGWFQSCWWFRDPAKHLGCIEKCVNNGINYQPQLILAGFLVAIKVSWFFSALRFCCGLWKWWETYKDLTRSLVPKRFLVIMGVYFLQEKRSLDVWYLYDIWCNPCLSIFAFFSSFFLILLATEHFLSHWTFSCTFLDLCPKNHDSVSSPYEVGIIDEELVKNLAICGAVILVVIFALVPNPRIAIWVPCGKLKRLRVEQWWCIGCDIQSIKGIVDVDTGTT